MKIFSHTTTWALIFVILFALAISPISYPKPAQAQGLNVPIGTDFDFHSIEQYVKSYVLDHLAWNIAKIAVQQITADTVQWINSGFSGSPAFLTNPEGYFLNIGDQVTGNFIQGNGFLSRTLCSPFNIDIRLALALKQSGNTRGNAYTCTLSSIIQNGKNATINGNSIQGFMNGDFSQGGWEGFVALSQPQNNEGGAYLQAHSDLVDSIMNKQETVNKQLTQGGGFLSWPDCKDIASDDVNDDAATTQFTLPEPTSDDANGLSVNTPSQNISVNPKTGSYQSCETKTPGSVINAQLNKQLGSGVDQLNLADSFDEITSALMQQLVTQVLRKGLGGASQKSSGDLQTYTQQLYAQATSSNASSGNTSSNSYGPYIAYAKQTTDSYQKIVDLFEGARGRFAVAQICLQNVASSTNTAQQGLLNHSGQATSLLQQLAADLNSQVAVPETKYQTYLTQSQALAAQVQKESDTAKSNTTASQDASQNIQDFFTNQVPIIQSNLDNSNANLVSVQAGIKSVTDTAAKYLQQCQSIGGH